MASNNRNVWRDEDEGISMEDFKTNVLPASRFLSWTQMGRDGLNALSTGVVTGISMLKENLLTPLIGRKRAASRDDDTIWDENDATEAGSGGVNASSKCPKVRKMGEDSASSYRK